LEGSSFSQWQADDTPGQIRQRFATGYAISQLNLGYLNALPPDATVRTIWRGTGAELCSSTWISVRAASGLIISSTVQPDAAGAALDITPLVGRLKADKELSKRMEDAIVQVDGVPLSGNPSLPPFIADLDPEQNGHYPEVVNGQEAKIPKPGTREGDKPVPAPARPLIALDAAASLNVATPKSAALFAGETLHWTVQADMHIAARNIFSLTSAGSAGFYAAKDGINIIAQHGRVISHTHQGKQTWSAKKEIVVTSSEDEIHIYAKKKITLNGGKTAIDLEGSNITLYMPMLLDIKAATHSYSMGGAKAGKLPKLPKGTFGAIAALGLLDDGQGQGGAQNVPALVNKAAPKAKDKASAESPEAAEETDDYVGRYQLFKTDNRPFEGYHYIIKDSGGQILKEGVTDKDGWTDYVHTKKPEELQAFKFVTRESERITENWKAELDSVANQAMNKDRR
jgi:type VI secretion system secreted protein VgrG